MIDESNRPWGNYKNIHNDSICKVKIIKVLPEKQPSYQYHHKRSEHWIVLSGTGVVTIDNLSREVGSGDYIFVPQLSKHRIKNASDTNELIFVEIQTGTYFGEDDIVRLEDDFGRS